MNPPDQKNKLDWIHDTIGGLPPCIYPVHRQVIQSVLQGYATPVQTIPCFKTTSAAMCSLMKLCGYQSDLVDSPNHKVYVKRLKNLSVLLDTDIPEDCILQIVATTRNSSVGNYTLVGVLLNTCEALVLIDDCWFFINHVTAHQVLSSIFNEDANGQGSKDRSKEIQISMFLALKRWCPARLQKSCLLSLISPYEKLKSLRAKGVMIGKKAFATARKACEELYYINIDGAKQLACIPVAQSCHRHTVNDTLSSVDGQTCNLRVLGRCGQLCVINSSRCKFHEKKNQGNKISIKRYYERSTEVTDGHAQRVHLYQAAGSLPPMMKGKLVPTCCKSHRISNISTLYGTRSSNSDDRKQATEDIVERHGGSLQKENKQIKLVFDEIAGDYQELMDRFGVPYVITPYKSLRLVDGIATGDLHVLLFEVITYSNIFRRDKYVQVYHVNGITKKNPPFLVELAKRDRVDNFLNVGSYMVRLHLSHTLQYLGESGSTIYQTSTSIIQRAFSKAFPGSLIVKTAKVSSEKMLMKYEREIEIGAQLRDLVTYHAMDESRSIPSLIAEDFGAQSLAALLEKNEEFNSDLIFVIFYSISILIRSNLATVFHHQPKRENGSRNETGLQQQTFALRNSNSLCFGLSRIAEAEEGIQTKYHQDSFRMNPGQQSG
ncbi:hypothetical protein PROFUN_12539 [Planoprotostelium fungivorum]|uniref:Uncharacterized protein n=1 Tax=Planoprotostelium fungivorum TaxID=1890364 RepID=A0A2P6MS53_9EUKA|nr:hypothetical protein PROFUN_12539 [Planoprotostelium fungivorum]